MPPVRLLKQPLLPSIPADHSGIGNFGQAPGLGQGAGTGKIPSNHPTLISPYFIENKLLHKSLDRTQNDMLICSFHLRSSQPYLINSYRIFSQNHTNKNNFMKLFGLRYRFVRPWCWRSRFPNIARPFVGGGGVRASRKWLQGVFFLFLVCFMIWKEIQWIMVIGEIPKYP